MPPAECGGLLRLRRAGEDEGHLPLMLRALGVQRGPGWQKEGQAGPVPRPAPGDCGGPPKGYPRHRLTPWNLGSYGRRLGPPFICSPEPQLGSEDSKPSMGKRG